VVGSEERILAAKSTPHSGLGIESGLCPLPPPHTIFFGISLKIMHFSAFHACYKVQMPIAWSDIL